MQFIFEKNLKKYFDLDLALEKKSNCSDSSDNHLLFKNELQSKILNVVSGT